MTKETLELFGTLLAQVTLRPVSDDFDEQARIVGQARRELIEALRPWGDFPIPGGSPPPQPPKD